MKYIRFISTLFLVVTAMAANADVTWLETVHNFGAFNEDDGVVQHSFRFVNSSDVPVAIVSARTSCGCTASKYSRSPIAPGDSSSILVTYDPAGRPGSFSKYVALTLSDGSATPKLYIKGIVIGSEASVSQLFPVQCGPVCLARGAVMAGEITKGQRRTIYLEAYNRSADSIMPIIDGRPPYIDVTPAPAVVPPGAQFTFLIYFNSAKAPDFGLISDSLSVRPFAEADIACMLPVTAFVNEDFSKLSDKQRLKAPHISLEDKSLDFGKLGSEPVSRSAVIKNIGKSPMKIHRVYTGDSGVKVDIAATTIKPGAATKVTVFVEPSKLPGDILNARISIISNDPDMPVATLRAVGEL